MSALISSNWTKTRALIARTKRSNPDADVADLQAQLKAERLAAYIERVTAAAPPIPLSKRNELAALLTGGGSA